LFEDWVSWFRCSWFSSVSPCKCNDNNSPLESSHELLVIHLSHHYS
jgi:hypothetical protein